MTLLWDPCFSCFFHFLPYMPVRGTIFSPLNTCVIYIVIFHNVNSNFMHLDCVTVVTTTTSSQLLSQILLRHNCCYNYYFAVSERCSLVGSSIHQLIFCCSSHSPRHYPKIYFAFLCFFGLSLVIKIIISPMCDVFLCVRTNLMFAF